MSWDITMLIRSINNNSIEESDKSRENRLHEHKQWPSRALYTLSPFLQPFSARHRAEMPKLEARTWHKCSVAKTVAILFTAGTIWNKREINAVTKKNTFRCRSRSLARHRPFSRSFNWRWIPVGQICGRTQKREEEEEMTPFSKNNHGQIYSNRKPFWLVVNSSDIAWRISFRENYITPFHWEASLWDNCCSLVLLTTFHLLLYCFSSYGKSINKNLIASLCMHKVN